VAVLFDLVISKSVLLHLRSSEEQVSETMARQFVRAVSNKNSDFLDQNSALSGLARQKLFMITKPGEMFSKGKLACVTLDLGTIFEGFFCKSSSLLNPVWYKYKKF
jgi:hypothetical protein